MNPLQRNAFPREFHSEAYGELCEKLAGYEHPQNNWRGAVCVLLIEEGLFLIKRSSQMPTHAGQIAFIGGHRHRDESLPWDVARREFNEESSLDSGQLEFVGHLPPVFTANQTQIIPVVCKFNGSAKSFSETVKSNGEWSCGYWLSLDEFKPETKWHFGWRHGENRSSALLHFALNPNAYHFIEGADPEITPQHEVLWGATARIVWNFLRVFHNPAS